MSSVYLRDACGSTPEPPPPPRLNPPGKPGGTGVIGGVTGGVVPLPEYGYRGGLGLVVGLVVVEVRGDTGVDGL